MSEAVYTSEDLSLKRYFSYSVFFHVALTAILIATIWLERSGDAWGGVGGGETGVKVSLASSAGIPMPPTINPTESQVVDPTKGLNVEEPQPKPPEQPKDTTNIPKFEKEKVLPPSKKSKVFEKKNTPPPNAVPYGKGGQMNVPTGYSDQPGPLNGGVAVQGQGGGDFATRYGWYIEAVRRAVNQNWLQNTIDPGIRAARRAKTTLTFTINRDGTVKDIRISESSGNRSMDDSASRALLSIEHFPPLPADYSGRYVDVTFDFDLSMTR
ncbi:MAG TPA: energy transducer TonB [Candidatus Acidoferrales bacterium]|jgi:protein TonB|nr:energy transducer TonB [Candidatus Acidoferrales bacterium]